MRLTAPVPHCKICVRRSTKKPPGGIRFLSLFSENANAAAGKRLLLFRFDSNMIDNSFFFTEQAVQRRYRDAIDRFGNRCVPGAAV